jgi:dihydrodipicolinate reductase
MGDLFKPCPSRAKLDYLATCLSANKAMVIGTMGFNGAGLTNLNNAKN